MKLLRASRLIAKAAKGRRRQATMGLPELGFALLVQELPEAKPKPSGAPKLSDADLLRQLKMW